MISSRKEIGGSRDGSSEIFSHQLMYGGHINLLDDFHLRVGVCRGDECSGGIVNQCSSFDWEAL